MIEFPLFVLFRSSFHLLLLISYDQFLCVTNVLLSDIRVPF